MKLPFAVYTARQGYAWQSGAEHGRENPERFRRAIGKMPEFDFGETGSRGVINVQDTIVAYRFMRQAKADSAGRDAAYLALTFFSREQARFIDADALFGNAPFNEPLQHPPSSLEYTGGPAIPGDFSLPTRSASGAVSSQSSLSSVGFVFSQPIPGTLRIYLPETPQAKPLFEYALATPQRTAPLIKATPQTPTSSSATDAPISPPVVIHSDFWKAIALVAVIVAIVEAALLGWMFWLSFSRQQQPEERMEQIETPSILEVTEAPESIAQPAAPAQLEKEPDATPEEQPPPPALDQSPEQAPAPVEGNSNE